MFLSMCMFLLSFNGINSYGYSHFIPNHLNDSLAPAIYWTLNTKNPTKNAVHVSFMFTISINIEQVYHSYGLL